jgi:hypothetical protein
LPLSCFIYAAALAADDPAATIGLHALSPAQRTGPFGAVKRIEGALVRVGDSLISEYTSHTLLFRYRTLKLFVLLLILPTGGSISSS